jgi:hypothetical protein
MIYNYNSWIQLLIDLYTYVLINILFGEEGQEVAS